MQLEPIFFELKLCNIDENYIYPLDCSIVQSGNMRPYFQYKKVGSREWNNFIHFGDSMTVWPGKKQFKSKNCKNKFLVATSSSYKNVFFEEKKDFFIRYIIFIDEDLICSPPIKLTIKKYEGIDKKAFDWLKTQRDPTFVFSILKFDIDQWAGTAFYNEKFKKDLQYLIDNFPGSTFEKWAKFNLMLLPFF